MEKTIELSGVKYNLKSSLGTIISYKSVFGSELFNDIQVLDKLKDKNDNNISKILDVIFKITYILHKPYSKKSYEEFLDDLDFSIISDTRALENLASVIGELLGTTSKNK